MILRQFPGNGRLQQKGTRELSFFGHQNVVVYAKSRYIAFAEHTAPLSIKTTLKGREIYEVNNLPINVEETSYLVLNNDQPYSSYICSDEEVESFCLFFRDGLDGEVAASLDSSHKELLEIAGENRISPAPFFQNLRRHDETVFRGLRRLHRGIAEGFASQLWLDEQFNSIMEALLEIQRQTFREAYNLHFVRRTTRVEIYRRLCRAKDYIESCYEEPVSLAVLAKVACLSQHHLLRLFKEAFRITPHQYLTDVRLRHARKLIAEEGCSVREACLAVGFENASSFSRLFKNRFGHSPRTLSK